MGGKVQAGQDSPRCHHLRWVTMISKGVTNSSLNRIALDTPAHGHLDIATTSKVLTDSSLNRVAPRAST
jgi:hypothetical protein